MPLAEQQRQFVNNFREWIESALSREERFGETLREDREDASTLVTRWPHDDDVWYEVAIRPFLPQVRVGIVTTDRWKSEEFEQMIEDSGDTMQEYVEAGFDAVDLEWPEPPVEHYRDQGRYFYFATPLDLKELNELADDDVREKVRLMFEGYYKAFTGQLD
jgi:hypothetical protein